MKSVLFKISSNRIILEYVRITSHYKLCTVSVFLFSKIAVRKDYIASENCFVQTWHDAIYFCLMSFANIITE